MRKIRSILIANRGEIACRIIRTCHRLGIKTLAVFSEIDRHAQHVQQADHAVCIGNAPAQESYLSISRLIAVAQSYRIDAIHPGYGFLSENPEFAEACIQSGFLWIGPSAQSIGNMGSKSIAKELMQKAGIPIIPGYHGSHQEAEFLFEQAQQIGFPILIKAVAGGGGKGMRIVKSSHDFFTALIACQREAEASFQNRDVLLEKLISAPRHIEFQIFGDSYGNMVHLFERECSIQRRHQKIIEETPSIFLDDTLRTKMSEVAVDVGKVVQYVGAGTVEFIVGKDQQFYFMEMNTRLQVEHPVTEMVSQEDLVEWQIRVAEGDALPKLQDQLSSNGHAIEARIYAEDANHHFLPSTGTIQRLHFPKENSWLRLDTGISEQDDVSIYYDPMLAKLIVWGETRGIAIHRLVQSLQKIELIGVQTNLSFLRSLVSSMPYQLHQMDTTYIDRHASMFVSNPQFPSDKLGILLATAWWQKANSSLHNDLSPWATRLGWRLNQSPLLCVEFKYNTESFLYRISVKNQEVLEIETANGTFTVKEISWTDPFLQCKINEQFYQTLILESELEWKIVFENQSFTFQQHNPLQYCLVDETFSGGLQAPMPGKVVAIFVESGETVEKGQALLVIEAMKMEHTIEAPYEGKIAEVRFAENDLVQADEILIRFQG